MGKAISRWISNLLLGKKREKNKRNFASYSVEYPVSEAAVDQATSKVKRRWSFGRSTGKEKLHVYSKSIDSIDASQLPLKIQAVVEYAAAVKIQATFRSYLARRALCALKSLVKLQSLVRGHLVRKQIKATLRQMHALMAIQVRARVHRIRLAQEAEFVKRQSYVSANLLHTNEFRTTDGYADYSFMTSQNIRKNHQSGRSSFSFERPNYADHQSLDFTILPNYMGNTESSKARVCRSQSEPKRRPNSSHRQKSKPMGSVDGVKVQPKVSFSRSKQTTHEHQESWFINLYRSNENVDSSSITTSNSNNGRSLYESDDIADQFARVVLSPS